MTNKELLRIALDQSAIDSACLAEDFMKQTGTVVVSKQNPRARRYLTLPFDLDLTSYGQGVVASCSPALCDIARDYIDRFPAEHCFETPNLHVLMDALRPHGLNICFMAEYWLPDVDVLRPLPCPYETRILHPRDFASLYLPEWSNALCEKRKHLDMLAVGAYDGDQLIGLAGCSADCDSMWQIGIDVLPKYRRCGVASSLTSILCLGDTSSWRGAVLLLRLVECGIREKCYPRRISSCLGHRDGKARGVHPRDQPGVTRRALPRTPYKGTFCKKFP